MRLDKLTIGSPKDSPTHTFKNLKNVTIDFDAAHWVTVVIGWNGTGKSNVLEALAIIFRDLITKKGPQFAYQLTYTIGPASGGRRIEIDADPDREKAPYVFHITRKSQDIADAKSGELALDSHVRSKLTKISKFLDEDHLNLPRYVFGYYSGESTRMRDVFRPYLESYDRLLRRGEDPGLRRLFFALPVHSQFVLLAFLIQQNEEVRAFLDEHLGLDPDEGIDSVLFVLRQPPWTSNAPDGDPRFWNARGIVRDFLAQLYETALAPVRITRRVPVSLWNKETLEYLYLYVKDIGALRSLVGGRTPAEFFRGLESTHVSELIEEVRIRVRLKKNDGGVTFRELSEGEQQLLTVLGLLRFTAEEQSLFLLDEPDTHLNPRWSVDYLNYLRKFVGTDDDNRESSHVVLTTHNPLAIAELEREQVQILRLSSQDGARKVVVSFPELDPRGQGYAAIVTSDMFGIASSMDKPTQLLLEKQRIYAGKRTLTDEEQAELERLNHSLSRLGFRFFHPDDEFSRYLRIRNEKLEARFGTADGDVLAGAVLQMSRDDREALATELIDELLAEESDLKNEFQ
ncbi:MAG TPA: AAA family ATPase [Longimicrobium sp.]